MMDGLITLQAWIILDKLKNTALDPEYGDPYEDVPYRVEDGEVVDDSGYVMYERSVLRPGEAEVIVALYNHIGFRQWDHILPLLNLLVGETKGQGSDGRQSNVG